MVRKAGTKVSGGSASRRSPSRGATARAAAAHAPAHHRSTRPAPEPAGRWPVIALAVVLGAAALRLAVNLAGPVPVHFDEAQYWFYGQELAFGHFSKPPLVGWLLALSEAAFGHQLWAMRLWPVAAHGAIAWVLFLAGRRMFGAEAGFWAAACYTAAPGVTASAMLASTDPVMMACWATALWAHLRATEEGKARWWALMGVAIGLGFLAKYTMLAFAAGALGFGLLSAPAGPKGRDWRGPALAAALAFAVMLPNLAWNALNGFATFAHVAEDAGGETGGARLDPLSLAEFAGSQLGVIGPVVFAALLAALWHWREWRADWRMRFLAWQAAPLLIAMLVLAFATRAQPNWAAPAYIAGALLAARWLAARGWRRLLRLQLWTGAGAAAAIWTLAFLYADQAASLPRWLDPFKKMRLGEPVCAAALPVLEEEGADALLVTDRRRLSECIWLGELGPGDFAVWNPSGVAANHFEMIASLAPGDPRTFVLVVQGEGRADPMLDAFEEAGHVETLRFATHSGKEFAFELWIVSGFRDYP